MIYVKKTLRGAVWIPDAIQGYYKINITDTHNFSAAGRDAYTVLTVVYL